MSEEAVTNKFSILIVDDEPKNIQLLGNLLKEENYDIEFATSGEEAIEWVYSKKFDLILLDIMMPGMDGYEVCKRVKTDNKVNHIPVIFLTAKTESEFIVKGFDVGGADYITKPFKSAELLARIKMHVEIKVLRGLIPICVKCKNVRNDEGIWKKIESYIEEHTNSMFSHGMCTSCMDDLYEGQEWYEKLKLSKKENKLK